MASRSTLVDPNCPTETPHSLAALLTGLGWFNLIGSATAALFIWIRFRIVDVPIGVGSPFPIVEYEQVINWPGIGLGFALILQGLIVFAVLRALASITLDVTGIRISSKAQARALIEAKVQP